MLQLIFVFFLFLPSASQMEEEVSNFVQDRHRFVVDILLSVALLEEEHEILTRQIEAFEFTQRERRNAMIASKSGKGKHIVWKRVFCFFQPKKFS